MTFGWEGKRAMAKIAPTGRLAQVTGKDVSIDPRTHYDAWADSYEGDLLDTYGYSAHRIAARALTDFVEPSAPVIDVGCGTGLVGAELAEAGFKTLDGVDVSGRMLDLARERGIYRQLFLRDVEGASALPDRAYGGVICAGAFGAGHLGPQALPRLAGLAAPGGMIVIFMNAEPFHEDDYDNHLSRLERAAVWHVHRVESHNYMDALERPGKLIVAQRGKR